MSRQELESLLTRVRQNRDSTPRPRLVLTRALAAGESAPNTSRSASSAMGGTPDRFAAAADSMAPESAAPETPRRVQQHRAAGAVHDSAFEAELNAEIDEEGPPTEEQISTSRASDLPLPSGPPATLGPSAFDLPVGGDAFDGSPTMASAVSVPGTPRVPQSFDAPSGPRPGAVPSGAVPSGAVPSGAVPSGAVPSGADAARAATPPRDVRIAAPAPPAAAPNLPRGASDAYDFTPEVINPVRHGANVADLIVEDGGAAASSFGGAIAAALTLRFTG